MADKVCAKCDVGWVIHLHDKHCGYCGCAVFDFSVKWKEEPLLYTGDDNNIHELTIFIGNAGACPIQFQLIQTTRNDIIQFPQQNDGSFEVKAGKLRAIPIQVNPANLTRLAETITVRAQNAPPNLKSAKSLRLQALPRPEFKLTPSPVIARHRKNTENVTVDLRVEVSQSQFYISGLKHNQQWVKNIHCLKGPYKAGTAAKVIGIEIDYTQLSEGLNTVKLRFQLRGISEIIEHEVQIQKEIEPEPARLFVPKMNLEVTQDRQKNLTLMLQNRGERQLTIRNIAFNDPSNLVQVLDVKYPIKIDADEHHNVEVLISAKGVEPQNYPINFTVSSNCGAAPQYQDVLNVRVNKQEEYPHYLAIDFGTTNSCCAYIDLDTYEPKLIPLDSKVNPPEIMPSLIVYHSNLTNGKTHHVGYDAETYRTSEIDGTYYISSVKRWLGYEWGRYFPNNQKLNPCDVVADILKHITEQAGDYLDKLKLPSKIERCVVSHPTMFLHEQREDFKRAFEKIGITDVKLIDEGSAASIATIFQRHKKNNSDYRLLVYDFGGGTIDIVLSQVTFRDGVINFEPLASGGNPRYGGDDVTQAIVDAVVEKFKSQIRSVNPDPDIPYFDPRKTPQSSGNQDIERAKRTNTGILYSQAEKIKRKLNEKTETEWLFDLSVVVGNDIRPLEVLTQNNNSLQLSTQELQTIIRPGLSATFDDIDTMIADNDEILPDIVILAGQSSKIHAVKEMMQVHFQKKYGKNINVQLGEPPKECVVLGAAEYGRHHTVPNTEGNWIEYSDLGNITHSRLGIVRITGRQPVFSEIIPKGKRIPKDSHNTIDFPLRSRETYIDVHEHFGTDNDLTNTSRVASYTLSLPEDVSNAELRKARLKMSVKTDNEIELIALVGDAKHETTVKKQEPAFVDEI